MAFVCNRARTAGRSISRAVSDERGFTIIEVLVSAILLVIASVGLFTAFDAATRASGTNKARTVASQLAQADQERLRSMTGSQLVGLNTASQTTTKNVDGRTFKIVSAAQWTSDPNSSSDCAGLGKEPGYQRIASTVSWPDRGVSWPDPGAPPPVESDSLKAVPNGGYSSTRGSLAVNLTNAAGNGTAGATVTAAGPTTVSATTNSSGCALFGFLPLGDYTVTVNQTGYVRDVLPNSQSFTKTVTVAGEQTSSVNFNYDQAASLGVAFYTRAVGAGSDTTTTGDGFSVGNSNLGPPYFVGFGLLSSPAATAFTGANGAAVASASARKVLYPFSDGYSVWAGECQENDPTQAPNNTTNPYTSTPVSPGAAVSNVKVFEPTIKPTVNRYTDSKQTKTSTASQAALVVIKPVTSGCTANASVATASNGTPTGTQPTLPYGNYTVCAQDKTSNPTKRTIQTITNNARNGSTLTLTLPYYNSNPAAC